MIEKPIPGFTPLTYEPIPPAMFVGLASVPNPVTLDGSTTFSSLLVTNNGLNLLGVGWLERAGQVNLYDTTAQTLISFSQAHDTLFLSGGGKVIGGEANNADTTPRAPIGTAESTLAKVWESITQLYAQGESYRAVTLEALGLQEPSYGFMPGDRPSLAPREISVFTPVPEQMYLAVRENNQCVWMRDRGHGTEVTRAANPILCAAAAPPSNPLWEPIITN